MTCVPFRKFTDSPNLLEYTRGFMKSFRNVCECGINGGIVNIDFTAGRFRIVCGSGTFTDVP